MVMANSIQLKVLSRILIIAIFGGKILDLMAIKVSNNMEIVKVQVVVMAVTNNLLI